METTSKRKVNKRLSSTKEYVDALQEKYSKILTVRVDLYCNKNDEGKADTSFDEANSDLNKMLNNRRNNRIFKDNIGYICKKEYTKDCGVHFHTAFFYNGNKVQNDIVKGQEIGNYWNKEIRKGNGHHNNCNLEANKKYGDNKAVGMMNYTEKELRTKLDNALVYLCKEDHQYMEQVKGSSKDRTFVRGTMPKKKSKAGRPRKEAKYD